MSVLFRIFSVAGVAVLSGVLIWIAFFVLLAFWSPTGFFMVPANDGNLYDRVRAGLMVGAVHGLIVAICVLIVRPESFLRAVLFALAATELCLLVLSTWWVFNAWPPSSRLYDMLTWSLIFFLIGSAAFLLPTLIVGSLAAKTQQLVVSRLYER